MIPHSSPERSSQFFENVATVMEEVLQAPAMDEQHLSCLVSTVDGLCMHKNNVHTHVS